MRFKLILILLTGIFFLNNPAYILAQSPKYSADSAKTARTHAADSTRKAREHATDSMAKARSHISDSVQVARKHKTDSIQLVRKKYTDSTAAIRKYRNSKKYKDSVAHARDAKTKSVKMTRQSKMDSLQEARKHATDSLALSRKERTDSIRSVQKRRTDSLATIKKYKTSKRYKDSVEIVRRERMDSIKTVQKAQRDNIAAIRKKSLDSAKAVRTHIMDSTKTARTKYTDSLKVVRKARADSIAKKKDLKSKLAKNNEKKKQEAQKLKLELKIKQKREAWSNKNMLKKSWSPVRRVAQNSFTHYNYYYNANRKMDEAEQNMQRAKKDNFDSLIGLYPFNPSKDSSLLAADMDSIIRKVSVGIQIHDPRVKWANDMYLLLGEAYYYKGSFENASIAFRYIISTDEENKKKEAGKDYEKSKDEPSIIDDESGGTLSFLKHKSVHNEAILWLARTYTQANQVENARSILSLVEYDPKFPDDLKGRLALEKAYADLSEENYEDATKQLAIAADDDNLPQWLRLRAAYLNGQLLQNVGEHEAAAESFQMVVDHYPKIDMDFYARKNIAYNKLASGQDVADAMDPLKKMLNDGKYATYYDQVYFILGQLAAKAHKNDEAITYLKKSTNTPKATKKQKAQSFAALGDVYYSMGKYSNAKLSYDSSAKYATSNTKDKAIAAAVQRSTGLKEVSGPVQVIHDQDSLLALAALSKKEQQSAVRRYLRELEKQRQDSIQNAENAALTTATPEPEGDKPDAGSWYFSNPTLMAQGSSDFKRKWGTRPLKDDWRRSAGAAFASSSNDNNGGMDGSSDEGDKERQGGELTEDKLLAKIPNTPQQKELAAKLEQRAYIMLAKAYLKQLEDYKQAIHTLDTLDIRYPNHNQKEEELYLRYQVAMKQNNLDKAKGYSDELLKKFPESQYAAALRPKKTETKAATLVDGQTVSAYFDQTYAMLQQHQYAEALARIEVGKKQFDNPVYKKRFEVAEAMAYAGKGDYDMSDTLTGKFIKANGSDTLTAWAKIIQKYVADMRKGGKPSWYDEAVAYNEKIAKAKKDEVKKAVASETPKAELLPPSPPPVFKNIPSNYSYNADSEHYCIIILPGLDSRTGVLKQNVKDFDNAKYSAANLSLLVDLYDMKQGVLVIKKFANADAAKKYLGDLKASNVLKDYKPDELKVLLITSSNYKKLYTDKEVLPYSSFYNAYYQ